MTGEAAAGTPIDGAAADALRRGIYDHLFGMHEFASLGIEVTHGGSRSWTGSATRC